MTALIVVVGLALVISFVCSILEAVLLSISHSYVALLQESGDRVGPMLARMRENIDEPIVAILTLNTIGHTVGAAVGGAMALQVFGDAWVALFSAFLTFAILVFSEIIPKTLGAAYWKRLAKPSAYVLQGMIVSMKPILAPLAWFSRLITPKGREGPLVSRAELEVLAELSRREGAIDEDEWQVVTNVINLDRVKVSQVMTPRTAMVAIPVESTVDQAQKVMLDEGRLRLPIYEETVDRVVGVLLARDLWRAEREGVEDVRSIMREPRFVPGSKVVEVLLTEMRSERIKMAIVLDEFGGTAGLVTLEDLIEEIVGEIHDEHEQEFMPFEDTPGGEVLIGGTVPVHDVNEHCDLDLPEDINDTIGGYVFGQLGRIATVGDQVSVPGGRFRVAAVKGRSIMRLAWAPDTSGRPAATAE
ncbi:MAG: hemolysin family protein [Gemmatimonadetes bacterium]|nr:hemolysin family protein [Gemmatimonadota bacterium]